MLQARIVNHQLKFKVPGKTSRGTLTHKESWYLLLQDNEIEYPGIGECSLLPGLSIDDRPDYVQKLNEVCTQINTGTAVESLELEPFPSIAFALEVALADLASPGSPQNILFPSAFTSGSAGIPINGLVWMGSRADMELQIKEKLKQGFNTIKLKVGGLDFETELDILRNIRKQFSPADITLRLDANGAFSPEEAPEKLKRLSEFSIHSIEQPLRQGQPEAMALLCRTSPIPVVLDEELIGIFSADQKFELLQTINPSFLILKPSLVGGFTASNEWISIARKLAVDWWITSALEGNIGLNAIAQWTYTLQNPLVHGLGTGQVYTNNIPSPLTISESKLYYMPEKNWDLSLLL